jgi:hypothetical protein
MRTRTVIAAAVVAFALAGAGLWWWAGGSGRRSDAIFQRMAEPGGLKAARAFEEDLRLLYKDDPSQAEDDWETHPEFRGPIAAAASTVPNCRPLVEKALRELGPPERFYITLCLATGGNPTLRDGIWTGTDSLRITDEWRAFLEARLDVETGIQVLILTAEALRGSGWKADRDAILAKAAEPARPVLSKGALLVVLAGEPGGARAIMDAAEKGSIEDEPLVMVLESGALRGEEDLREWVERVIAGGAHPVAAGGAFVSLLTMYPDLRDRLFETARAAPKGRRLPFMMALLKHTDWPPTYKAWWIAAWESDAKADPAARAAIAANGLGTIAAWAAREEKNPQIRLALETIYDFLRK